MFVVTLAVVVVYESFVICAMKEGLGGRYTMLRGWQWHISSLVCCVFQTTCAWLTGLTYSIRLVQKFWFHSNWSSWNEQVTKKQSGNSLKMLIMHIQVNNKKTAALTFLFFRQVLVRHITNYQESYWNIYLCTLSLWCVVNIQNKYYFYIFHFIDRLQKCPQVVSISVCTALCNLILQLLPWRGKVCSSVPWIWTWP